MSIVTITLGTRSFNLSCDSGSEEQLLQLSEKLGERIINIKSANPAASFELILVMTALGLQDQIQNLQVKLNKQDNSNDSVDEEKFAETLSTIAGYLENLAKKIGK